MTRVPRLRRTLAQFAELRRALPMLAAGLLLVAIFLPMWRIILEAPQYPEAMFIELYAYPRLEGDVREVQMLNQYVGFYFPDPVFLEPNFEVHENAISVPEWSFGPLVFLAVAAAGAFVAIAPTERKLRLGLTSQLVGTLTVFGGMFAVIQYRLHQAGHSLDPAAPFVGVDGFTPPVIGSYEIANISGYATLGSGAYLTLVAVVLLVVAFTLRRSEAKIWDTPRVIRAVPGQVRERLHRSRPTPRTDGGAND